MQHFTIEDGLPSAEVYDIVQDDWGNLWLSTDHGLSRYDGYQFKNYSTKDGLTDNTVFNFFKQKNGEIWCNTFNHSLFSISGAHPIFKPYRYNDSLQAAISDALVQYYLMVLDDGALNIGFTNHPGYAHITNKGQLSFTEREIKDSASIHLRFFNEKENFVYVTSKTHTPPNTIISPTLDWVSYGARATALPLYNTSVFSANNELILVQSNQQVIRLPHEFEPISLGQLDSAHFWVGYRFGGLEIYDYNGNLQQKFLAGQSITEVLIDHEKGMWISTLENGVYRIGNASIQSISLKNEVQWVQSLAMNENKELFVGGYNGTVHQIQKNTPKLIYSDTTKRPVNVAFDEKNNRIVIGSNSGIYQVKDASAHLLCDVRSNRFQLFETTKMISSSYGRTVLFQSDSLIAKVPTKHRIADYVYYNDSLYIGAKKGLYRLDGTKLKPVHHHLKYCKTRIEALEQSPLGLFIGTRGNGLGVLNGERCHVIDEKAGLCSNFISNLYAEGDSAVWVCTNAGLNRIVFKEETEYTIQQLTQKDGLPSNAVTAVLREGNRIFVGTKKGLCFFDADLLLPQKEQTIPYHLHLNNIKVNDTKFGVKNLRELEYNENRLEFNFQAVSFKNARQLKYRYRLKGIENQWTYTTGRRALYPSLPPGDYTFQLQVKGENNEWKSEKLQLAITIALPYWETLWFKSGSAALIILLIWLFFRYRILIYNRDLIRELLRQTLKRIRKPTNHFIIKEQGNEIRIDTSTILFVKSSSNYIEIHTEKGTHVVRCKIGEFMDMVPDPIEFLRIRRSYIIRIDKVDAKNKKEVVIGNEKIPVGETYLKELDKIKL
jgi:ligand-binding sensor domain-containing protein